ncbi:MAG: FAD/NAD(P)-binding protein [Dokdonella sp.]
MSESHSVDIAIIGAGASGVMVAVQIARQSLAAGIAMPSVLLIDQAKQAGIGIAYSTTRPEHLLNVVAGRISILPSESGHFVDWLLEQGEAPVGLADRFVPRDLFGRYLQAQLQHTQAAGVQVRGEQVVALDMGAAHRIRFASGGHVDAGAVVLAIGNNPRKLPLPHDGIDVFEAWDHTKVASIAADDRIAIIGAGLSMVDAVLTLAANGHRGRIDVFSRHGLTPLAHDADHDSADIDIDAFAMMPLRARLHHLRQWAVDHPSRAWQAMMRTLRDPGQRLWQSLGDDDQRRFLRHVVRYWDIHRHRVAPQVAATLASLRESGHLTVNAARPVSIRAEGDRIELIFIPRHQSTTKALTFDCVINATGLESHLDSSANPLLRSMFTVGLTRAGPHGRGLDTSSDGHLIDRGGAVQPNLYTLGSPRVGSLWESIAIPDLRVQASELAASLLHGRAIQTRDGCRE